MIIEIKKLSELKPAPYNARISSKEDEKHLKKSLEKFGVVEPIIYNKRSGYIVGGHFRVRELIKLGYEEVHCVIVDLDEQNERELNIRLNANTGSFDWDELANHWDYQELYDYGLKLPINKEDFEFVAEPTKEPTMKITFKSPEDLQKAENEIQEILDREFDGAYLSINL